LHEEASAWIPGEIAAAEVLGASGCAVTTTLLALLVARAEEVAAKALVADIPRAAAG